MYNQNKMAEDLRKMRQEAGFTQRELAQRLGVSRETVLAIENKRPYALNSLSMQLVKTWFAVCRQNAHCNTRERFIEGLKRFFKL